MPAQEVANTAQRVSQCYYSFLLFYILVPSHSLSFSPSPSLSFSLCLRAFCSWLVVCALLCHCICVSLGYAKSITRHNRISYGGTPSSLTHLQSPSPSLFHSHSPFPFHHIPISSFRCLGVFQFDMLDRFSLI